VKQSLQLRLGQQLTMTPQLQQAIRLLQLSSLDLQAEIQQVLDSNLMLETAEDVEIRSDEKALAEHEPATSEFDENAGADSATDELPTVDANAESESIPDELPVDSGWDDIYDGSTAYSAGDPSDRRDPLENHTDDGETLQDYLRWQANLTPFSEQDAVIAEAIIDSVADDGYLICDLDEIHDLLPSEWKVDAGQIDAVLQRIQHFDPVGVAARNPREALLIQLGVLDPETPRRAAALDLVEHHLDLLVNRQYAQLMRRMKVDEDELKRILALIRQLDPRPGSRFGGQRTEYVIPDVYVYKQRGEWRVELNRESTPRLRINSYYASLVRRADNSSENTTLRSHLQEARWFLKSLQSRNETLLKVAQCIVTHQSAFLEQGEEAMQPLVLREVAEEVGMHESTISRITTQKYMHTPRGTLEFKYFFSSHVQTADGGECSATAIRARIRRLIAAEDPARPLSDNQLTQLLREEGINVARRTVAKYREAMAIVSSTERKRLA